MTTTDVKPVKRVPVLTLIAGAVLAFSFFTPLLIVSLPIMVCVALCIVAAVRKEEPRFLPYMIGGGAALLFFASHAGSIFSNHDDNIKASTLYSNATWQYGSARDDMRGIVTKWATLDSPTDLELPAPYEGTNGAHIQIGSSGGIIFTVDKGQLECRSFQHQTVSIKFDDGPVYEYPCSEPNNGQTGVIYINSRYDEKGRDHLDDPVTRMSKAKRAVIEVELYSAGYRQFTFNVANLDLSKIK